MNRSVPKSAEQPQDSVRAERTFSQGIHFREVAPSWHESVCGVNAPPWTSLEREPRAWKLKSNEVRQVWRVELDWGTLIAKIYDETGWRANLRRWFRGSQARREFAMTREFARRGLAAPAVTYADGVSINRRNRSICLLEAWEPAESLADEWRRARSSSQTEPTNTAKTMLQALADFTAAAHRQGLCHLDPHPRNILVRRDRDGRWSFRYIDVSNARISSAPRLHHLHLARLSHWFQRHSHITHRWRFLRRYVDQLDQSGTGRGARRTEVDALWRRIDDLARRESVVLVSKRDRRIFKGRNRYFATVRLPNGWTARVVIRVHHGDEFPAIHPPAATTDAWQRFLSERVINSIDQPTEKRASLNVPDAGRPATPPQSGSDERHWQLWIRNAGAQGPNRLATVQGRRLFYLAHQLRHRQIPCLCPVAWLERKSGMHTEAGAMVFADFDPAFSFGRMSATTKYHKSTATAQSRLRAQLDQLGALIEPVPPQCIVQLVDESGTCRPVVDVSRALPEMGFVRVGLAS